MPDTSQNQNQNTGQGQQGQQPPVAPGWGTNTQRAPGTAPSYKPVGSSLPQGGSVANPNAATDVKTDTPRTRPSLKCKSGMEHVHQGYGGDKWASAWHCTDQRHKDQRGHDITESLHETSGLGKDGKGGDTATRAMGGAVGPRDESLGTRLKERLKGEGGGLSKEDQTADGTVPSKEGDESQEKPIELTPEEERQRKVDNAKAALKLGGAMLAKNLAFSAGDIADKAFNGIRSAMKAMLSPNPLSASGQVLCGALGDIQDMSQKQAEIQEKYGLGNPDAQTLEGTFAGQLATRETAIVKKGTNEAMKRISAMIDEASEGVPIEQMSQEQLTRFSDNLNKEVMRVFDEVNADDHLPNAQKMPAAQYRAKMAMLSVYKDAADGVAKRSKENKATYKEYAARVVHDQRYRNKMNRIAQKERDAIDEAEYQQRYAQMPSYAKMVKDEMGRKVNLDDDGIAIDESKRTAQKNKLKSYIRQIEALRNTNKGLSTGEPGDEGTVTIGENSKIPANEKTLKEFRDAVRMIENRERKEKAERDARERAAVIGGETGQYPSSTARILNKNNVLYSKKTDSDGVAYGVKLTPTVLNDLTADRRNIHAKLAAQGLTEDQIRQDKSYIEARNTEVAYTERKLMDDITNYINKLSANSDEDIAKYNEGKMSRQRLETIASEIARDYHRNRQEGKLWEGQDYNEYDPNLISDESHAAFLQKAKEFRAELGMKDPGNRPKEKKEETDGEVKPKGRRRKKTADGETETQSDGETIHADDNDEARTLTGPSADLRGMTEEQYQQALQGPYEGSPTYTDQGQSYVPPSAVDRTFADTPTETQVGDARADVDALAERYGVPFGGGSIEDHIGNVADRVIEGGNADDIRQLSNAVNTIRGWRNIPTKSKGKGNSEAGNLDRVADRRDLGRLRVSQRALRDMAQSDPEKLRRYVDDYSVAGAQGLEGLDRRLNADTNEAERTLSSWGVDTTGMHPDQIYEALYNEAERRGDDENMALAVRTANAMDIRNAYNMVHDPSKQYRDFQYRPYIDPAQTPDAQQAQPGQISQDQLVQALQSLIGQQPQQDLRNPGRDLSVKDIIDRHAGEHDRAMEEQAAPKPRRATGVAEDYDEYRADQIAKMFGITPEQMKGAEPGRKLEYLGKLYKGVRDVSKADKQKLTRAVNQALADRNEYQAGNRGEGHDREFDEWLGSRGGWDAKRKAQEEAEKEAEKPAEKPAPQEPSGSPQIVKLPDGTEVDISGLSAEDVKDLLGTGGGMKVVDETDAGPGLDLDGLDLDDETLGLFDDILSEPKEEPKAQPSMDANQGLFDFNGDFAGGYEEPAPQPEPEPVPEPEPAPEPEGEGGRKEYLRGQTLRAATKEEKKIATQEMEDAAQALATRLGVPMTGGPITFLMTLKRNGIGAERTEAAKILEKYRSVIKRKDGDPAVRTLGWAKKK